MKMVSYLLLFWLALILLLMMQTYRNQQEGFTPKIRSMYRPYMRNARLTLESYTNKYNSDYAMGFLRRIGLY